MTEATETQATEERTTPEAAPVKAERVFQNGITKPKEGTKTGDVWATADAISAKNGEPAGRKEVLDACEKRGINPATAATQYGKWRIFYGLVGDKAPKRDVAEKPAKAPKEKKAPAKKGAKAKEEDPAAPEEAPAAPTAPAAPAVDIEEDDEV